MADESLDRQVVDRLRLRGHEVWYVAEMEPGITDDVVLERANQVDALLGTADKDFGELVFRTRRVTTGVILVRLAGMPAERKAEIVVTEIERHSHELLGAFTVITPGRVRIRRMFPS